MLIYVDFFSIIKNFNGAKYHGGGNYARRIVKCISTSDDDNTVCILCPNGYSANQDNEPDLFGIDNIKWVHCKKDLSDVVFEENSIVFFPLLLASVLDVHKVFSLKRNYSSIRIYGTIHDTRFLYSIYDYTTKYYEKRLNRLLYPLYYFFVHKMAKAIIMRAALRCVLKKMDKIFTVSNHSMQCLLKESNNLTADLSWYYQTFNAKEVNTAKALVDGEYILFLSGGRKVKNLGHALLGFNLFIERNPESNMKMVITGIDKQTFDNLLDIPGIDRRLMKKRCVLLGYVSEEDISNIYANCKFVLYTSKYEGFGLPLIEAALYGKTSIASNVSSIPEVLGACVKYINPCNDESIASAIVYFSDNNNLNRYERRIQTIRSQLIQRMELDAQAFIEDFLS